MLEKPLALWMLLNEGIDKGAEQVFGSFALSDQIDLSRRRERESLSLLIHCIADTFKTFRKVHTFQ